MRQHMHAYTAHICHITKAGGVVWNGVSSHDKETGETARSSRHENAKVYYELLKVMKASRASRVSINGR